MEGFVTSQFNFGSLAWMFCSRKSNEKINRIHERALRIAYNDYNTSFTDLLTKIGSDTKHISHVKKLAVEMFKVYKGYIGFLH